MRYYVDGVDALVSLDLVDVVEAHFGPCEITVISDLSEVDEDGAGYRPSVLISARSQFELQNDLNVAAFLRRGGGVVVMDDWTDIAPEDGPTWVTVTRPFGDDELIAAIQKVRP